MFNLIVNHGNTNLNPGVYMYVCEYKWKFKGFKM